MTIDLEDAAAEIRTLLQDKSATDCAPRLCGIVSRMLNDDAFVARHLPDRARGEHPRAVLYEDAETGFCICGHVYEGHAESAPHDHGSSWAIYGQAEGETEMTDWKIVQAGSGDEAALVEPLRTYLLRRGDAHFYDVGAVHSPKREASTRLIRVEGANLDHVQRSKIRAA